MLVSLILFGGGYRYAQIKERGLNDHRPILEPAGENKVKEFKVHVTGAVAKPGVYQILQGARIIDAVNMAVPTGEADLDSLKLAAPVTDGQTIPVPYKATSLEIPASATGNATGASYAQSGATGQNSFVPAQGVRPAGSAAGGQVNINTADLSELDTLPGIGPAIAQRIIQYRETNGPFNTAEDLKNVSGIGDKKFESLKDKITVY